MGTNKGFEEPNAEYMLIVQTMRYVLMELKINEF